ncbi:ABC transporter permease subunit [Syntrophomonas curvata]
MLLNRPTFPQLIIILFLALLVVLAIYADIPVTGLLSDSMVRLAMNGILVLSLLPMLKAGVGINYGLPVGIEAGLIGMCLAVNYRFSGFGGFCAALLAASLTAIVFGYLYALILNRVRGREEVAGVFIGFSVVMVMNFFWATAPFRNPAMLWPIGGQGMRPTIGLTAYFARILNGMGVIHWGPMVIPFGFLACFILIALLLGYFFKTRTGLALAAVGENEKFCALNGIRVNRIRSLAIIMSTVLAALGICFYAQSYGFIELYEAPLMMAFPAASAVLLGGSLSGRASIAQAIIGTFLFHAVYVFTGPIANNLLIPEVSEIMRVIIANGIILYALLYQGERRSHAQD